MKTIIIGGGISGLAAAYHLKNDYIIFEKENTAGGLCRSIKTGGFTFDYSGHFLHLRNDYSKNLVFSLLGKNINSISRNSCIYSNKAFTKYPFQANLFGLPDKVVQECISGLIQAKNTLKNQGPLKRNITFHDWILRTFGKGFAKHFFFPYNEKLWTVNTKALTTDWIDIFIPQPSLKEVIDGAYSDQKKAFGYNASFYYPEKGGIQSLIDSIKSKTQNLRLNSPVSKVDAENKYVTSNGLQIKYDNLISTMPLPELLTSIVNLPKEIISAKNKLLWTSVDCVNIGVKHKNLKKGVHWIYFPEKEFAFYRTGFYHNFTKKAVPDKCSSMYVEVSYKPDKKPSRVSIIKKVILGLRRSGIIDDKCTILKTQVLSMPYAYVIYDKNRTKALETINSFLKKKNIYSIGRYGAWKYSYIEESILDAKATAELILKNE
ncbi:MAG: FAD-dependent oxidoreductase [Elusimicrobia bacterium]|nr:FAD-dependent oxidoreductase [Elusimicrobiota bacterium]